eukprot:8768093-Alexandrium_andersonii.AAC.1
MSASLVGSEMCIRDSLTPPGGAYIIRGVTDYFSQSVEFDFRAVRDADVFDDALHASAHAGLGASIALRSPEGHHFRLPRAGDLPSVTLTRSFQSCPVGVPGR